MTLGQVLGLIAIILGVVAANITKHVIFGMGVLEWFVLAIALVLVLGVGAIPVPFGRRSDGT